MNLLHDQELMVREEVEEEREVRGVEEEEELETTHSTMVVDEAVEYQEQTTQIR